MNTDKSYFYIQRINFTDHKGPITGVDCIFDYSYMGNSYYEFNALNRSLKNLINLDLQISSTKHVTNANRGLFLICEKKDEELYRSYIELFLEDNCGEEKIYLKESLSDDGILSTKYRFNVFECWWDINNHFLFCFGKENARRIIKGIKAYKAKLDNKDTLS